MTIIVAFLIVLAGATPAHADPIFTPLFTTLLTSAGVSATAVAFGTTTWVALLSGIATVALGLGLAMLLTPKPPKPEDGQVAVQQPVSPQIYGYGRARIAGAIVFKETNGSRLFHVSALTGHTIIGFVSWWLNDDQVTLAADGLVSVAGSDGRYGTSVWLHGRVGNAPEAPYWPLIDSMPGYWTTAHRGDHCASLLLICGGVQSKEFAKVYPYGPPQPSAVIDLIRVYDPRVPGQVWNDPGTWTTSGYDNPALALLHFECFSDYGMHRDFATAVLPVLSEWIAEANICDEQVPLRAGGTEPRYRLGGWTTTEQSDPRGTRVQILQACDGWFVERGDGTIILRVGKYRAPTVELTDDDIAGWSWQSGLSNDDRGEWLVAKYTSPANGYSTVDTDGTALDNGPIALGQNRTINLDLPWVQSTGQASRLKKREAIRYAETVRGQLELRLSALNALYERWVKVSDTCSVPRLRGRVIENRRPVIALMDGKSTLDFIGSGPQIDDYDPTVDESAPPSVPTRPSQTGAPVPANVAAVAEEVGTSGSVQIYIDVSFDAPQTGSDDRTDLSYDVQWRLVGASSWDHVLVSDIVISAHRITISTSLVAAGSSYEVRVASVSGGGAYSAWSTVVPVSTATASVAPASPVSLSVSTVSGHPRVAWTAPNSPNVSKCRVWRAPAGGTFTLATSVSGALTATANQAMTWDDAAAGSGTWLYWVTAENSAATASSPSGPVSITI